jgi:hypothetical protein
MGPSRTATLVAATLGLAIAAWVGYAMHQQARERGEQRAAAAMVAEATARLRDSARGPAAGTLEALEGDLKLARTWRNGALGDATEHYLIATREILRRRGEAERLAQRAAASRTALAMHMRRSARRNSAWIRTAAELKKTVEREHRELDVELTALAHLLETFPDTLKRIEPLVDAAILLDEGARLQAHRDVLAAASYASAELEKTRRLR